MNLLLEKFKDYKTITNYEFNYELEMGERITFKLHEYNFIHLIGLHKLIDIDIIRRFNDKSNKIVNTSYILKKIANQHILTHEVICKSKYYPLIKDRYESFNAQNILSLTFNEVIIDFNAEKVPSKLKAKYIFSDKLENNNYRHLCVASQGCGDYYVETYFYNNTDTYIRQQKVVKVSSVEIRDARGEFYMGYDCNGRLS